MTAIDKLEELRACRDAVEWAKQYTDDPQRGWDECERGDWMLWLLAMLSGSSRTKRRKRLVLCACECARLALEYVSEGEDQPEKAIETVEAWARNECSIDDVRKAADAAYATTYAADAAADAAAYAAYAATDAAADAAAYAAYAATDAAADAAYVAGKATLKQCADIVRRHYPECPLKDDRQRASG